MKQRSKIAISATVAIALLIICGITYRSLRLDGPRRSTPNVASKDMESANRPADPSASSNPTPPVSLPSVSEHDKQNLTKIAKTFSAPISFYGRVVDQNGQPIAQAKVDYSAADRYFGDSSKYDGVSDDNGFFSITGIKGAGLYVSVFKQGFDGTPDSHGSFGYGVPSGRQPPSSSQPAVFVLRKKREAEPIIHLDKDIVLPKNGTPVHVSLHTGKVVPSGRGDIVLELWAQDRQNSTARAYDWNFRLSVPGGGLTRREKAEMQFEAPDAQYDSLLEVGMSQTSESWRENFDDEFFIKLADGSFGRMRFRITAGGGHFASITSYLNPTPGSRNLEFDPKKQIKVQ